MSLLLLAAIAVIWAMCALLAAGWWYAYAQREFPSIAEDMRRADVRSARALALLGPFAVFALFVLGDYEHGWLWPGKKP